MSETGERGPQGDHGQAGDIGPHGLTGQTGDQGSRGLTGQTGDQGPAGQTSTGERGPQGDHGQVGDMGPYGHPGSQGVAGATGATGPAGAPGQSFSRAQILTLYIFMLAAFLLLAWRSEVNHDGIEDTVQRQRVSDYQDCQARNINVERLNQLYMGLIRIEEDNPYRETSPTTVERRIDLYKSAVLTLPDCGDRP